MQLPFIHAMQKQGAYDQPARLLQCILSIYNQETHVVQSQRYIYSGNMLKMGGQIFCEHVHL
jgi:hypothetical protein